MGSEEDGEDVLVLDLGGRSTELSWQKEGVCRGCSLPFGAVNLTSSFLSSLSEGNLSRVKEFVYELLDKQSGLLPGEKRRKFIGLGGTVTTLVALSLNLRQYNPEQVHRYCLSKAEVEKWEQFFYILHGRK